MFEQLSVWGVCALLKVADTGACKSRAPLARISAYVYIYTHGNEIKGIGLNLQHALSLS